MRVGLILALLVGCGVQPAEESLRVLVADTPIELEAPTTILVQIVVVGADGAPVAVTSPNLPSFATLHATTMQLKPGYGDAGDYAIDLVARTGSETSTGTMHIRVNRINTGPMWLPFPTFTSGNGDHAPYANFEGLVCDHEEDNFRLEINVVPAGSPLTNHVDFAFNVDFTVTPPVPSEPNNYCAAIHVDLPGLATGDYIAAVHAVDVHGAEDPYGWVVGFVIGGDNMTFHVTNSD